MVVPSVGITGAVGGTAPIETHRVILKLGPAVIVAAIAGAVLWIEHGHRIVTDAPTAAELAASRAATACLDNENVPYGENCIVFMQGVAAADGRWRRNAAESAPVGSPDAPGRAELPGPACPPNNENVPYSASCLRFMSGWFWRANAAEGTAPTSAYAPN